MQACREVRAQLDRSTTAHRVSVEPARVRLERLKRELDRIQSIDYLESPLGRRARALWETVSKRLQTMAARPRAATRQPHHALPPSGSTWVTRPRPHIDRIASAWLVQRFIDPHARFAFADPTDAPHKGIPFDILGAEFGHHGEDCTFETLLKRFGLKDRRLRIIAEIVHEADLRDGKFPRHEASRAGPALKGLAGNTHAADHLR